MSRERTVISPDFKYPVRISGAGPYHVEEVGCVVIVCDGQGINRVGFEFDDPFGVVKTFFSTTLINEGDARDKLERLVEQINSQLPN